MVLEEGVGFEPTEVSPSSVFKTDAIGHSANLPFGTELFSGNLCSVLGASHHIIGRKQEVGSLYGQCPTIKPQYDYTIY